VIDDQRAVFHETNEEPCLTRHQDHREGHADDGDCKACRVMYEIFESKRKQCESRLWVEISMIIPL
jgi:hypothetical protein